MDDDLKRVDDEILYLKLVIESLWLFLASDDSFDAELAAGLIEEAARQTEQKKDMGRERSLRSVQMSLEKLAARIRKLRPLFGRRYNSPAPEEI